MPPFINLTGNTYGSLKVLKRVKSTGYGTFWLCLCKCGNLTKARSDRLKLKKVKLTCGACYSEHKYPKEWKAWRDCITRCYNPNREGYHRYGGRGITVCNRWKLEFLDFFADMGLATTDKHSLDRVDNDGNYEPSNCKWSTMKEQQNNKTYGNRWTLLDK